MDCFHAMVYLQAPPLVVASRVSKKANLPCFHVKMNEEESSYGRPFVRCTAWELQVQRLSSSSLGSRHDCNRMTVTTVSIAASERKK